MSSDKAKQAAREFMLEWPISVVQIGIASSEKCEGELSALLDRFRLEGQVEEMKTLVAHMKFDGSKGVSKLWSFGAILEYCKERLASLRAGERRSSK